MWPVEGFTKKALGYRSCLQAAAPGTRSRVSTKDPWCRSALQLINSSRKGSFPFNACGMEQAPLDLPSNLRLSAPPSGQAGAGRSCRIRLLAGHGGPGGAERPQRRGSLRRLLGAWCQHEGGLNGRVTRDPRGRWCQEGLWQLRCYRPPPIPLPPPWSLAGRRAMDGRRHGSGKGLWCGGPRGVVGDCSLGSCPDARSGCAALPCARTPSRRRLSRQGFTVVVKAGSVVPAVVSFRPAPPRGQPGRGTRGPRLAGCPRFAERQPGRGWGERALALRSAAE